MNSRNMLWLGAAGLVALSSCVTINVYFPAAAAEKAADTIIEEVWGKQPGAAESTEPEPQSRRAVGRWFAALVELALPAAHAQANLEIATPAINKLKASMKSRHRDLSEYYGVGAAGLTRDGLIAVRDAKLVPLNKRNRLKQLVAAENSDRTALYKEIAIANGHAEWEKDIRGTFARRWVNKASSGWWYDFGNGWQQK